MPGSANDNLLSLDTLLRTTPAIWRGHERYAASGGVATGYAALDAALPSRGWSAGGVTELLCDDHGIGELSLLLPALSEITAAGRWAALVNPPHLPYAPAFANAGVRLDRLLVVDSRRDEDALWASEQLLRAGHFDVVILHVDRTTAQRQRRLQLAAEHGGSWSVVYRPASAREEHSPVSARIALEVVDGQLALDVLKARGGQSRALTIDPSAFDGPQGGEWPLKTARERCLEAVGLQSSIGDARSVSACLAAGVGGCPAPVTLRIV